MMKTPYTDIMEKANTDVVDIETVYVHAVFYYIPWFAVLFLIFAISSQPADTLPHFENNVIDKIAHIVEYGILGFCTVRIGNLLLNRKSGNTSNHYMLLFIGVFLFVAGFGLFDEIHQIFVEGRTFDLVDLMMDIIGVTLIIIVYRIFLRTRFGIYFA